MIAPCQAKKSQARPGAGSRTGQLRFLGTLRRCRPGTSTRPRGFAARQTFAAGEGKAASRGKLLPERRADAHQSYDPRLNKTGCGEQRAYVTADPDAMFRPCMPVGERAIQRVTWNHFCVCPPAQLLAVQPFNSVAENLIRFLPGCGGVPGAATRISPCTS